MQSYVCNSDVEALTLTAYRLCSHESTSWSYPFLTALLALYALYTMPHSDRSALHLPTPESGIEATLILVET